MENLHFKIWAAWIECMLCWIMESDFLDYPSDLMLISCLTWLSCPKSLQSFFNRIILQSDCINLIESLVEYYLRRSIIRDESKYTLLPIIVCLSCAIIHKCNVHRGCSSIAYVAIRKIPVCSIFQVIPIILF